MGVQGAKPLAGGAGVSPEHLPFLCTGALYQYDEQTT